MLLPGFHRRARLALGFVVAVLFLPLAAQDARASTSAQASPPPQALRLPRSLFPSNATMSRGPASNSTAQSASMLHMQSFDAIGRVGGYLQTARWLAARRPGESPAISLQYVASMFDSPDSALTALGDARATLWELGLATPLQGTAHSAFTITERDGHRDVYVLLQTGAVEAELRLRFATSLDASSVRWAEWYLGRIVAAANARAATVSAQIPAPTSTPAPAPIEQNVFEAPWGTGPVVESPSLMTVTPLSSAEGADAGAYRGDVGPALAGRAVRPVVLLPRGGLSRYVRTAAGTDHEGWYDSSTLYSSAATAEQAFETLVKQNAAKPGLRHPLVTLPPAQAPEGWSAWRAGSERIFLMRTQNVVLVLASTGAPLPDATQLALQALAAVPTWLHAAGTQIEDGHGTPVRLAYLNWYGAESPDFIPGGLDVRPYRAILTSIARLGYNGIRVPFSNQMVEQNPIITAHVGANPDLAGLHALDLLDRIVAYAGAIGLRVVLDDHRSDAGWSAQESGLWYTPAYPDTSFTHDWSALAARYAVNNVVIGADLRNEPHGPATWGDGNLGTDWHLAAERAGDAALAANPNLLIIVEGIQYYGPSGSYWWGGNLMGVATAPVELQLTNGSSARSQLVYSAHDYGPNNCQGACPWFNATTTYDSLAAVWDRMWGYITADPAQPYAAPVWVGEFGTCNQQIQCIRDSTPGSQGQWFTSIVQYIAAHHLSWAYWAVNGTESSGATRTYGSLDWYGLLATDWSSPVDALNAMLATIQPKGSAPTA